MSGLTACGDPRDFAINTMADTITISGTWPDTLSTGIVSGTTYTLGPATNIGVNSGWDPNTTLKVTGDIEMNGKSVAARLDKIEERLSIIQPNTSLESRWIKLKRLGDKYKALEKELMEKEKMWEIIKR